MNGAYKMFGVLSSFRMHALIYKSEKIQRIQFFPQFCANPNVIKNHSKSKCLIRHGKHEDNPGQRPKTRIGQPNVSLINTDTHSVCICSCPCPHSLS